MLAGEDIPASDKRVRFIGLKNFESAAGLVRCDLFAEGEAGTYVTDAAKLNRLVGEKLQAYTTLVSNAAPDRTCCLRVREKWRA